MVACVLSLRGYKAAVLCVVYVAVVGVCFVLDLTRHVYPPGRHPSRPNTVCSFDPAKVVHNGINTLMLHSRQCIGAPLSADFLSKSVAPTGCKLRVVILLIRVLLAALSEKLSGTYSHP